MLVALTAGRLRVRRGERYHTDVIGARRVIVERSADNPLVSGTGVVGLAKQDGDSVRTFVSSRI